MTIRTVTCVCYRSRWSPPPFNEQTDTHTQTDTHNDVERDERLAVGRVRGDDDDRLPGHAAVGQGQRGSDIHERSHQTGAEHAPDTAERADPEGPGGRGVDRVRVHSRVAGHQPVRDPRRPRAPRGGQQPADPSRSSRKAITIITPSYNRFSLRGLII